MMPVCPRYWSFESKINMLRYSVDGYYCAKLQVIPIRGFRFIVLTYTHSYTPKDIETKWLLYCAAVSSRIGIDRSTKSANIYITCHNKKLSWCWQNARRTYRSVKVTKHSTIPYVRYFTSCAMVTFSLKRAVFPIFDVKKCRDLENRVRGPSRSLEMSPRDRAHMTCCWRSIVTMALSRLVSEIFNVEKCRDLKIGVRGHSRFLPPRRSNSRSLKVLPFGRSCMVSC